MALLVQILQGRNMMDIKVKATNNAELEEVIPVDRVVTIDDNGYTYLFDKCIQITEDMIEEVL